LRGDTNSIFNNFSFVPILPEFILSGEEKLLVQGDFYVAYEVDVDVILNIGYDLNFDASPYHYFNLGRGWFFTAQTGALMINPVLGAPLSDEYVVSVNEEVLNTFDFKLFPNPVNAALSIQSNVSKGWIEIIDMLGRTVLESNWNANGFIDVKSLEIGMYILRLTDLERGISAASQFIKQ